METFFDRWKEVISHTRTRPGVPIPQATPVYLYHRRPGGRPGVPIPQPDRFRCRCAYTTTRPAPLPAPLRSRLPGRHAVPLPLPLRSRSRSAPGTYTTRPAHDPTPEVPISRGHRPGNLPGGVVPIAPHPLVPVAPARTGRGADRRPLVPSRTGKRGNCPRRGATPHNRSRQATLPPQRRFSNFPLLGGLPAAGRPAYGCYPVFSGFRCVLVSAVCYPCSYSCSESSSGSPSSCCRMIRMACVSIPMTSCGWMLVG